MATERGVGVAEALATAETRFGLGRPDRRLAAQLTYGVLRHRRLLDWWMGPFLRKVPEPVVRNILRMAYFQDAFLDRVPRYALVSGAVDLAKEYRPPAQGLVNAVLRRGLDVRPEAPDPAVRWSHPDWLVARWQARWPDDVAAILERSNATPPLTLRVSPGVSAVSLVEDLRRAGGEAALSRYVPGAIRVTSAVWLEDWSPFQTGQVVVQDESSQLVAGVVAPNPGDHILDLAAGLGGKTLHLLANWDDVTVTAVDVDGQRLRRLQETADRLGLSHRLRTVVQDGRRLPEAWRGRFSRVLLDAPCSGLGVLRRRVDGRWHKRPEDLPVLHARQVALLDQALRAVEPGGVVVYSTCSVEPEETDAVLVEVLRVWPAVLRESPAPFLPHQALRRLASADGLVLQPGQFGFDGFFIARLRQSPLPPTGPSLGPQGGPPATEEEGP